ncbi:Uncharacterised protein [Mycobacteroides abscessus subsp. abscessus]|nr:Uncharacterised protein [Mycobacteroides abscessus subsp. abscessus]SIN52805.1 Uncharacterised protein [Mycobacteroides abscessus subsp. abscessus]
MPSATSSAMEPVGITEMGWRTSSPSRMTEPLPKLLSICASASSRAFSRSGACAMVFSVSSLCSKIGFPIG